MTNRVAVGNVAGTIGLFVSQPGQDVLTCDPGYLLYSMNGRQSQVLASGSVTFAANTSGTIVVPFTNNTTAIPMGVFYEAFQVGSGTAVRSNWSWTTYSLNATALAVTCASGLTNTAIIATYIILTDNSSG